MPKAKKLKSGSWNCRVVDHYEMVDGKKKAVMRSFTVKDPSRSGQVKCERLASQFKSRKHECGGSLSIGEAVRRYIEAKASILSPTTLHAYRSLLKNAYTSIETARLATCSQELLQRWVGTFSRTHSPKTVRNAVALLAASYDMQGEVFPRLTLPQRRPPELETPTDADIKALLDAVEGTELEKAILLGAFGTLRRGEICALDASDLDGNILTVRHALVVTDEGLAIKAPKTPSSVRQVELPPFVADRIRKPSGRLVELTPPALTDSFARAREKVGVTFRFHDLRAYAASIRHALGIPDVYIMQDGGWKNDATLKNIYRRAMDDKRSGFEKTAHAHFEKVVGG